MPSFNIAALSTEVRTLDGSGNLGVITSSGALVSVSGTAVTVTALGAGAHLVNAGMISANARAVLAQQSMNLINTGLISCEATAILIDIDRVTATTTTLSNSGDIISSTASCIFSFEAGVDISNAGRLISGSETIEITTTDLGVTSDISNSGLIQSRDGEAIVSSGQVRLVNTGTIQGDIVLGAGSDSVDTRFGTLTGTITLGAGNNLLRADAGDNTATSLQGNDQLRGFGGNDTLTSGDGIDLLAGGDGDDLLLGEDGNDALFGGRGDDELRAGNGVDNLRGGADADRFVFSGVGGGSPTTGVADRISDMQRGLDVIDLALVAPTTLVFVGQNAFSGGGAASVRFIKSEGFVTLQADIDGNGTADFHLQVDGVGALSAADLIL